MRAKKDMVIVFASVVIICIASGYLWRWHTLRVGMAQLNQAIISGNVKELDAILTKRPYLATHFDSAVTPLHLVVLSSLFLDDELLAVEMAKILVKHGENVDVIDIAGRTPLHLSTQLQKPELVTFFIRAGADVNRQTPDGETPLHFASRTGNQKIVKILLRNKAIADSQDKYGNTPVEYARAKGYDKIANLLVGKSFHLIKNRSPFENPLPVEVQPLPHDQNDKVQRKKRPNPTKVDGDQKPRDEKKPSQ